MDDQFFSKIIVFHVIDKPLHCNHNSILKNSLEHFSKATCPDYSSIAVGYFFNLTFCETSYVMITNVSSTSIYRHLGSAPSPYYLEDSSFKSSKTVNIPV
ncbi:hypothetical protein BS78_01G329300 [Paspalum vaginatum]|nr:hypothetical protein BS78_01G329300 [Paspalum vaginatum]